MSLFVMAFLGWQAWRHMLRAVEDLACGYRVNDSLASLFLVIAEWEVKVTAESDQEAVAFAFQMLTSLISFDNQSGAFLVSDFPIMHPA